MAAIMSDLSQIKNTMRFALVRFDSPPWETSDEKIIIGLADWLVAIVSEPKVVYKIPSEDFGPKFWKIKEEDASKFDYKLLECELLATSNDQEEMLGFKRNFCSFGSVETPPAISRSSRHKKQEYTPGDSQQASGGGKPSEENMVENADLQDEVKSPKNKSKKPKHTESGSDPDILLEKLAMEEARLQIISRSAKPADDLLNISEEQQSEIVEFKTPERPKKRKPEKKNIEANADSSSESEMALTPTPPKFRLRIQIEKEKQARLQAELNLIKLEKERLMKEKEIKTLDAAVSKKKKHRRRKSSSSSSSSTDASESSSSSEEEKKKKKKSHKKKKKEEKKEKKTLPDERRLNPETIEQTDGFYILSDEYKIEKQKFDRLRTEDSGRFVANLMSALMPRGELKSFSWAGGYHPTDKQKSIKPALPNDFKEVIYTTTLKLYNVTRGIIKGKMIKKLSNEKRDSKKNKK